MIAQKKSLRKITMATSVVAMAVGLVITLSIDANASATTGGHGQWVETNCICVATGQIVGHSNDCNPGTSNCNDNDCSGSSCNK